MANFFRSDFRFVFDGERAAGCNGRDNASMLAPEAPRPVRGGAARAPGRSPMQRSSRRRLSRQRRPVLLGVEQLEVRVVPVASPFALGNLAPPNGNGATGFTLN